MAISYKKLFKLLIDRDLKKKDLRDLTGISYATLHKLERGDNVMTDVLNNICVALGCDLGGYRRNHPGSTDIQRGQQTGITRGKCHVPKKQSDA